MSLMYPFIKKIPLFSGLTDKTIDEIEAFARIKFFNTGENIFFDSEPYRGFYAVISGLVKIYKISRDGREHILHIIGPFNIFAEVPMLENLDKIIEEDFRYPANSMALEDNTQVIFFPALEFVEILRKDINIALRMLSGLAKKLRHLNHHIEELTLKDVIRRTAGLLISEYNKLTLQKPAGYDVISINISRSDMASYLGTATETLSRTLGKLQSDGIIEVHGKKIRIIDFPKLKEISLI